MNTDLLRRLAAALVACHRLLIGHPSAGRRQLFNAVNEAFAYLPMRGAE